MRLLALDVGDETDAAGILLQSEVVEPFGGGPPGMLTKTVLANGVLFHPGLEHVAGIASRFASRGRRQRIRHDVFALELRPAHLKSSCRLRASPSASAHLGRCGTHRATARPPRAVMSYIPELRPERSASPTNRPAFDPRAPKRPFQRCNPRAGAAVEIKTAILS